MTSSNKIIFRVTGPFWGESTSHRQIPQRLHKSQWREIFMFSLICAWTTSWANTWEAGDLRRHRAHYGVPAMPWNKHTPLLCYVFPWFWYPILVDPMDLFTYIRLGCLTSASATEGPLRNIGEIDWFLSIEKHNKTRTACLILRT